MEKENIDKRHYIRNTIIGLQQYHKPFLIQGYFVKSFSSEYRITLTNIRPYIKKLNVRISQICDHINVFMNEELFREFSTHHYCMYTKIIILANPVLYHDKDNIQRGGILLCTSLNVKPICTQNTSSHIDNIDESLLINWLDVAEGRYAWLQNRRRWTEAGHLKSKKKKLNEKKKRASISNQIHIKKIKEKEKRKKIQDFKFLTNKVHHHSLNSVIDDNICDLNKDNYI